MKLQPLSGVAFDGESSKAIQACNDYLRCGPGRSLTGLLQFYDTHYQHAKAANKSEALHQSAPKRTEIEAAPGAALTVPLAPLRPPTLSLDALKKWSTSYKWRERALSYDWGLEEEKEAYLRAHRLHSYGVTSARIATLKEVAELLKAQIFERSVSDDLQALITGAKSREYHNLWVSEQKMLGSGEFAELVEVQRFNPSIIDHLRGCLKEIAQELGERHYSADANKVLRDLSNRLDRTQFSGAQIERIAAGEHPVMVLLEPYLIHKDGD